MVANYIVEYGVPIGARIEPHYYQTDDPVACEQFLISLLECGFKIRDIRHRGIALSKTEFNRMVKTAASMLAAECICTSLDLNVEQERYEFGFVS
jgi:hypothetical protein